MLVDFIVLSVLTMFLISGWRQGVVKSLVYFIGSILSIGLSVFLSNPVAEFTYSSFLKPIVTKKIDENLESKNDEVLPSFLVKILAWRGITHEKTEKIVRSPDPTKNLESVVSPVIIGCLRMLLLSIFFWILMIFVKKIARLTNSFFKVPVLSHINSVLGATFGFFKGALIVWIVVIMIKVTSSYSENPKVFDNSINGSFVLKKFCEFNPISKDFISSKTSQIASILPGKTKFT
jgi:uncharacterized membrane protein required for colicin V production